MSNPIESHGEDPILSRARALPQAIEPARELWPGIDSAMRKPATQGRWLRAVAAALLVGVSSAVTFLITSSIDQPVEDVVVSQPPVAMFGPTFAGGTDIVLTRARMLRAVQNDLAELSPATRAVLTTNLDKIEAARAEINAALQNHPNSELLQHLLLTSYTDELKLLGQIEGMTRTAKQRIKL